MPTSPKAARAAQRQLQTVRTNSCSRRGPSGFHRLRLRRPYTRLRRQNFQLHYHWQLQLCSDRHQLVQKAIHSVVHHLASLSKRRKVARMARSVRVAIFASGRSLRRLAHEAHYPQLQLVRIRNGQNVLEGNWTSQAGDQVQHSINFQLAMDECTLRRACLTISMSTRTSSLQTTDFLCLGLPQEMPSTQGNGQTWWTTTEVRSSIAVHN